MKESKQNTGDSTAKWVISVISLMAAAGLIVGGAVYFISGTAPAETTVTETETTVTETTVTETTTASEQITTTTTTEVTTTTTETTVAEEQDTTQPLILSYSNMILNVGDEFGYDNVYANISYIDDLDSEPVLSYTGTVDTNTVGEYPITASVTDKSGNVSTASMTVSVVGPDYTAETTAAAEETYTSFTDFAAKYDSSSVMLGIDVSKWQGDIDFTKVAAAGCDFVIIRCGVVSDGQLETDKYFEQNYQNAKAAGLKVGIYYSSIDNDPEVLADRVESMLSILNGDSLNFPVAFDWERWSGIQKYKMSIRDLRNLYTVFDSVCVSMGYESMLYGSKHYLNDIWQPEAEWKIWLAHYTEQTDYTGEYYMWQQSCTGKIDGIDGAVDMDIAYISEG